MKFSEVAGSRSDESPSGAFNRTSGSAMPNVGRSDRQALDLLGFVASTIYYTFQIVWTLAHKDKDKKD